MQFKQQPKMQQAKAQQARAQQPKVPQTKAVPSQMPQRKTQLVKSLQTKSKIVAVKPQAKVNPVTGLSKPQQSFQITPGPGSSPAASQLSVKSPQAITVTVKPLEPNPVKQPLPRNQVAISLASHSNKPISTSVSVSSGVTITPEPTGKTTLEMPQTSVGKLQSILPKPQVSSTALKSTSPSSSVSMSARGSSNSWESSSSSSPSRQQFIPLSSSPVVNLTRSISLTAVPSTPTSMPDLHPINPQMSRPNRSPSTTLPCVSVTSSRVPVSSSSSGAYVSIIPTSPTKPAYSATSSLSLNKPASITPIYTSQPLPAPMNVTSTTTSASSVSSPAVASTENRAANAGKVQVAAGGKFFYLTIPQFKKLQTLRQQRQQEQQKKLLKAQAAKQEKERRSSSSKPTSSVQKSDLEVVEVREIDSEAQLSPLPTISAVCSGDQAKAMWNDESRNSESDPSVSISVAPPVVEITPIISKPDISVENMPKIPKTLTVTQIRKESQPLPKTVAASGISLTITRQTCQTPVAPPISSPALDIFPS